MIEWEEVGVAVIIVKSNVRLKNKNLTLTGLPVFKFPWEPYRNYFKDSQGRANEKVKVKKKVSKFFSLRNFKLSTFIRRRGYAKKTPKATN